MEIIHDYILTDLTHTSFGLLNYNLDIVTEIPVNLQFCIYNSYISCDRKKIVFNSSDEKALLFINLMNKKYNKLDTSNIIKSDFSCIYYWRNNYLILITYDGDFYHYDEISNTLAPLSKAAVYKKFKFIEFYKFYRMFTVKFSVDSCNMSFIHEEKSAGIATFYDFKNKYNITSKIPINIAYHSIRYFDKIFAFISEDLIVFCKGEKTYELSPPMNDIFKIIRFIKEDNKLFAVIFSSNKFDSFISRIQKYHISP